MAGRRCAARASASASPCARLLMSSLVHAKCVNSSTWHMTCVFGETNFLIWIVQLFPVLIKKAGGPGIFYFYSLEGIRGHLTCIDPFCTGCGF